MRRVSAILAALDEFVPLLNLFYQRWRDGQA
jgi:hypothetical protein